MNGSEIVIQLERLALLHKINRSEDLIKEYEGITSKRTMQQAVFELLLIKRDYNCKYGFDNKATN